MLLLFLIFSCHTVFSGHDAPAPRHVINLDLPPEQRWSQIASIYNDSLHKSVEILLQKRIYQIALKILKPLLENEELVDQWFGEAQAAEVRSIAKFTGLELAVLTALNGIYDLTAYDKSDGKMCTGIVTQNTAGEIFHGRNLDYSLKQIMVNITFIGDFQRNGTTLYSGVMYFGMTGFNTVLVPNKFTLSHDERDQGSILDNMDDVFLQKRIFTFTFLRQVAETAKTFTDAVDTFKTHKFSAPSYFIIGGLNAGEGTVVTHNRDDFADVWSIGDDDKNWYVFETNYDHWEPVDPTDDRRSIIQTQLDKTGPDNMDKDHLFNIMLDKEYAPSKGQRAINNNATVYSVFFQAAKPAEMEVLIHFDW